jgi:hypothetical protein
MLHWLYQSRILIPKLSQSIPPCTLYLQPALSKGCAGFALSVCPSVCLSVLPPACLPTCLSVCLSVCRPARLYVCHICSFGCTPSIFTVWLNTKPCDFSSPPTRSLLYISALSKGCAGFACLPACLPACLSVSLSAWLPIRHICSFGAQLRYLQSD